MSLPLDVLARIDGLERKPRIIATYDPPVYVCKPCRTPDVYWEAKGCPPCTCPPVWQNMSGDAEDALTLEDWLASL